MSKLLSIAALVQVASFPCLKCSNHLVTSLPISSIHTALQSPSLLLSSIYHPVNPGSNQVSLTAWSRQVTHSPKLNSSARCSSSSKPPAIPLPSSAFYIHSPFLFFQQTTYLPFMVQAIHGIPSFFFFVLNTHSSFKAHLKYNPFFDSFLNFAHSPQQMIGSLLVLLLALSTWHCRERSIQLSPSKDCSVNLWSDRASDTQ